MSYPILPMAIVTFLAEISEERSKLAAGPIHITILAHQNETVWSRRLELQNNDQMGAVVDEAVRLFNEHDVDTMTIIYPEDNGQPVDFGVILEANKPPFFFQWSFSPKFTIHLAPEHIIQNISRGVGVETMQGLLDKAARNSGKPAFPIRPSISYGAANKP